MSASTASIIRQSLPEIKQDVFADETLFITGCTGFLGKVILEKVMRTFPCKRIYVLLRSKKNRDVCTRFITSILGSNIFDRLRDKHGPGYWSWTKNLVFPIAGDLLVPGIGISTSDRARLTLEVSVIIHSAASVDFDLPLDEATKINVDGSLEMLQFAKECGKLKSHVHVSTCYVNCNQRGIIRESVCPCPFDAEQMYREIKSSSPSELAKRKDAIIRDWPNTYTFTKFLTEHLLLNTRGDVPLVICRPSIIAASLAEPVPGWTDSISAATAVFLAAGMGICRTLPGSVWNVADVVPVDLCASMILLGAAAAVAVDGRVDQLSDSAVPVLHCGTSSTKDPMMWFHASSTIPWYFNMNPPPNQVFKSDCALIEDERAYSRKRFWESQLPSSILSLIDKVTAGSIKPVSDLSKALKFGERVTDIFAFFTTNEWIYDSDFVRRRQPESDALFGLNQLDSIDWYQYMLLVSYGMRKFCLGQPNAELPLNGTMHGHVLQRSRGYRIAERHPNPPSRGCDSEWVRNRVPMNYEAPSHESISDRVLKSLKSQIDANSIGRSGHVSSRRRKAMEDQVRAHLDRMGTRFMHSSVRFFGYTLQKLFTSMFERISVTESGINELSKLIACADSKGPTLLIPTHRSYLDFLMLSYILFAYHVKVPLIAAGEDFEKIPGINTLLRQAGAFYMRRKISKSDDSVYYDTFKGYFQEALMSHGLVEFFIEGTRSRTGQTLHAKNGLLSFAYELVTSGRIPDLNIIPVSMTYERVLEAGTFPGELLGEPKVKETLGRIVRGVSVLGSQHGRANIVFGSPISVKNWLAGESSSDVRKLGKLITDKLDQGLVVMITHVVAAALVNSARTGSVKDSDLVAQAEWIRDLLVSRNLRCEIPTSGPLIESVTRCIDIYFKDFVVRQNEDVYINAKNPHSILMLAYYRNQLLSSLRDEAIVTVAILTSLQPFRGVAKGELIRLVDFVAPLLGRTVDAITVIDRMAVDGSIVVVNDTVKLQRDNSDLHQFVCALIYPAIDSTWLTLTALGWKGPQPLATIEQVHKFALSMYREGVVKLQESCTTDAIKLAVDSLVRLGVIDRAGTVQVENLDELKDKVSKYRFDSHNTIDEVNRINESATVLESSKAPTAARL